MSYILTKHLCIIAFIPTEVAVVSRPDLISECALDHFSQHFLIVSTVQPTENKITQPTDKMIYELPWKAHVILHLPLPDYLLQLAVPILPLFHQCVLRLGSGR